MLRGQNFLVFGNFLVVLMFLQKMLWLWFMFYLCPFWKGGVWSQDFRSNFVNRIFIVLLILIGCGQMC